MTLIVVSGAPGTGKSTIAAATEVFCRCDPRLALDRPRPGSVTAGIPLTVT
ncbi:MAG TPA: hypothetical protein VE864_12525 [Streptosporangiaceae bacterium]|nr:hypothetical protein [Streptosporangiaceae bacterium]